MVTRGADTAAAVVGLGGQGPSASSPQTEVSPDPSCPWAPLPQHLRVASSCGEEQPRITESLWSGASLSLKGFRRARPLRAWLDSGFAGV